jgi:hypothetical protein
MAVVTAHPRNTPPDPEGGNSYKITFPIEQVRLYAYFFFITLIGFAMLLFNTLVKPIIAAGAPEGTPVERLGCGYFNRVSEIYYPPASQPIGWYTMHTYTCAVLVIGFHSSNDL